jgi:RNA polymerase sigma-70 factor (ECF subfamily)
MNEPDDLSLLSAVAQQRDRGAFAALYERHREHAFNLALQILQDSALSQDAVQEAMLSIWLCTKPIPQDANARAWILRIVSIKSCNLRRQRKRQSKREEVTAMEKPREAVAAGEPIEAKERIDALRRQYEELPELERLVLACNYGANMPQAEIAELAGVSQQAISNKIQQALAHLRTNLASAGVASIVPLTTAENLFEVLTTGSACPPGMTELLINRLESVRTKAARPRSRSRIKIQRSGSMLPGSVAIAATVAAAIGFMFAGKSVEKTVATQPVPLRTISTAVPEPVVVKDNLLFEDRAEDKTTPWRLQDLKAEHIQTKIDGKQAWVLRIASVVPGQRGYAIAKLPRVPSALAIEYSSLIERQLGDDGNSVTLMFHDLGESENLASHPFRANMGTWHRWRLEYYLDGKSSLLFRTYVDGKLMRESRAEGTTEDNVGISTVDSCVLYKDFRVVEIDPLREPDRK